MLSFFNGTFTNTRMIVDMRYWAYVKDGLKVNTDSVISYYRNSAFAVNSDHEIIKILHGIGVDTSLDLTTYVRRVNAYASNLSQQLGYTSSISAGRIFNNVFLGGDSREVIITTDESFDYARAAKEWKTQQPIRVLWHNFRHLDGFLYDGKFPSSGITVYSINISLLAVQYWAYQRWLNTLVTANGARPSIYHFAFAYPIGNMQYSSIDLSVFNRFMGIATNKPDNSRRYRHPFFLTDYSSKCDDNIRSAIANYTRAGKIPFGLFLRFIPTVFANTGIELLKLPDVVETRQLSWAVYLARINPLIFIVEQLADKLWGDQSTLNYIKYMLGLYLRDNAIRNAVPSAIYAVEKPKIEKLIQTL